MAAPSREKGDHDKAIINYTAATLIDPKAGHTFYDWGDSCRRG